MRWSRSSGPEVDLHNGILRKGQLKPVRATRPSTAVTGTRPSAVSISSFGDASVTQYNLSIEFTITKDAMESTAASSELQKGGAVGKERRGQTATSELYPGTASSYELLRAMASRQ